jgi:hypothetical protein
VGAVDAAGGSAGATNTPANVVCWSLVALANMAHFSADAPEFDPSAVSVPVQDELAMFAASECAGAMGGARA